MGIGTHDGNFLMEALLLLLYLAFQVLKDTLGVLHKHVLKQILSIIKGALAKLNLNYKTVPYTVCLSCHCTYIPIYVKGSSISTYPDYCTHYPRPEAQCGELLLESCTNGEKQPKKAFIYYNFNDYLANLLSHSDIEALMDQSCDELAALLSFPKPHFVKNIFNAQFLHEFGGLDPLKLFIDRCGEGYYVFVLHVNFFNPKGMNLHGASTLSGIISMAYLNLPLDIRYKPENMYLAGIIPGPKQLWLENLNYYIHPFMKDLVISWKQGNVRGSSKSMKYGTWSFGICHNWDPACQLVIDSIHCIFEGLVQHHTQSLLGLTTENTSATQTSPPTFYYDFVHLESDMEAVQ
ncbi:hypothetical protein HD554DRAFT_2171569 [Boletus coccyginus]|nr:hypothetical protein HD554DRAFT_2171569 [Boletus coccyginus]